MKNKSNSGFIMGGCTMIGIGVGYLTGNEKSFMFIGIGLGLVLAYLLPVFIKEKES